MENSYQLNYYFDMNYYLFGKILSTELLFGLNYYTDLKSIYYAQQCLKKVKNSAPAVCKNQRNINRTEVGQKLLLRSV